MITEVERNIYERINYSDKYLKIKNNYINNGIDTPIFRVPEIKKIFKQIDGFTYKYVGEGSHQISKFVTDFFITYNFVISSNIVYVYMYIKIDGRKIGPSETLLGMVLRYISYNETEMKQVNETFGLNSLQDLDSYIHDFIELCNEFVDEYIKEIEAGNILIK